MNLHPILAALALTAGVAHAGEASPLAPLDFLLGTWQASGGGAPGEAKGSCSFARDLQGRVVVRTNHAEYPATKERPAFTHDDLMVIFAADGSALKADYYDNEGHVIHYGVEPGAAGEVVFLSEPSPSAPRFRLSYKQTGEGAVDGQFEIAAPGKPEAFAPYLAWSSRKVMPDRGRAK